MRRVLGAVAIVFLAAACSAPGGGGDGLPDTATVTYAFRDSSVPPQYHRSETLTVTRESAHLVIGSYGDVLADETVATPPEVWDALGRTLGEVDSLEPEVMDTGCTGGTGASIEVRTEATSVVDLQVEFCGGTNGAMEAPMAAWIRPARDLFPPTDTLAPEGE